MHNSNKPVSKNNKEEKQNQLKFERFLEQELKNYEREKLLKNSSFCNILEYSRCPSDSN